MRWVAIKNEFILLGKMKKNISQKSGAKYKTWKNRVRKNLTVVEKYRFGAVFSTVKAYFYETLWQDA